MRTPKATAWDPADLKQTEGYVRFSIHWGFIFGPLLSLLLLTAGPMSLASPIPWLYLAVLTTALWGALAVLHTRLRDADLLSASRWDAVVRLRDPRPAWVAWIGGGVTTAVVGAWATPGFGTMAGVVVGLNVALLIMPLLDLPSGVPLSLVALALGAGHVVRLPLEGMPPGGARNVVLVIPTLFVGVTMALLVVFSARMLLNILKTTKALDRARRDSARLAVAEERLRFARDLHDVFGRTLSAVALKSELAAAQADRGRPEAAATMREVESIATSALDEVRGIVRGYRDIDLSTEIAGARSLLEASGIGVTSVTDGAGLPAPVLRTFAWVVREGATNVLRHSQASTARIALTVDASGARVIVSNDGARENDRPDASGSGLAGLAERLADIGGTLDHRLDGDRFTLTAQVDAAQLARLASATASEETLQAVTDADPTDDRSPA